MTDTNSQPWLETLRQVQEELKRQPLWVQQSQKELSRKQYPQPPLSPADPELTELPDELDRTPTEIY